MEAPDNKKCHQYSLDYLKLDFIASSNETLSLCLVCEKTLCNDAMKPSTLRDHWHRMHIDKEDKGV